MTIITDVSGLTKSRFHANIYAMTSHGEQAERQAFVQASIDATRSALLEPSMTVHIMSQMGFDSWMFHERLNRRLFAAEVQEDGVIRIPDTQIQQSGVPVVAIAPGETPTLSPDFARLSPTAKLQMHKQFEAWRATDPEQCTAAIEYFTRRLLETEPIAFPNVFTPSSEQRVLHATVFSPYATLAFKQDAFAVPQNPVKGILVQPVIGLLYEGPDTPPVSPAVMIHEQRHVDQHEGLRVFDTSVIADGDAYKLRIELEANHDGAAFVQAQLDGGLERAQLGEFDEQQLTVEALRARENRWVSDRFRPAPKLMAHLSTILQDDITY